MKKENKTVRGLLKKLGICLVAGSMIGSVISAPGIVSAQELPTGGHWETINQIKASDFAAATHGNCNYYSVGNTATTTSTNGKYRVERVSRDWNRYPDLTIKPEDANGITIKKTKSDWSTTDVSQGLHAGTDYWAWLNSSKCSVFYIQHKWGSGKWNDWTDSGSGIRFGGIYADLDGGVQVGDKIRITAKVFPTSEAIYDFNGNDNASSYEANRRNYSQSADLDKTLKSNAEKTMRELYPTAPETEVMNLWLCNDDYAKNDPESGKPATTQNIKFDQWNDVVLEYTVDETNRSVDSVRLDARDRSKSGACNYPSATITYYGGVKVEKYVEPTGSYTIADGSMTGNVTAAVTDDAKMVIAAYSGNEMVGAAIKDCSAAESSYDFSIANVTAANKVIAYIWKLDNANPVLAPIPLTAN